MAEVTPKVLGIKEQLIERIEQGNVQHEKTFREYETEVYSRYPRSKFIEIFLPMFSGEVVQDDFLLAQWREIAGDNTRPVNLIDDEGKVVDQVPPLSPLDVYNHTPQRRVSLYDQVSLVDKGVIRDPDTHVYNAGMLLIKDLQSPEKLAKVQQKWIDLVKRLKGEGTGAQAASGGDDMWEY